MEFYCSEKFRVNSNGSRSDIWLIYKCLKCDATRKLTIAKGIKPSDLPEGEFDRFTNNDRELAWKYAFDRSFLKRQSCVIEYANIKYSVKGFELANNDLPLLIHLKSVYIFDLKLSKFLANLLGISVGKVKTLDVGFHPMPHELFEKSSTKTLVKKPQRGFLMGLRGEIPSQGFGDGVPKTLDIMKCRIRADMDVWVIDNSLKISS